MTQLDIDDIDIGVPQKNDICDVVKITLWLPFICVWYVHPNSSISWAYVYNKPQIIKLCLVLEDDGA